MDSVFMLQKYSRQDGWINLKAFSTLELAEKALKENETKDRAFDVWNTYVINCYKINT